MSIIEQAECPDPVAAADLDELGSWPVCEALVGVDLSLDDRPRVSALPWRGQFSPVTVERLLGALAPRDGCILDPFAGSGTTLLEAARRGQEAIGLDVNPAAVAFARWACLASLPVEERRVRLGSALSVGLAADAAERLRTTPAIDEAHAAALLAHIERSPERARRRLAALCAALPEEPVRVRAELRDARATGLEQGTIAFILTSPPYINVFNYHQYGRPLSDDFGWPVLTAARSEIGSNRQNRGNRFRTVIQYAMDMSLALREMSRVLRPGGRAVVVVGRESRVRRTAFYNGELLARVARRAGLFQRLARAERVFVSRFGERIYEDVLVLSESHPPVVSTSDMEEVGRAAGVEALRECRADVDVQDEVHAALADAHRVVPSPVAVEVRA